MLDHQFKVYASAVKAFENVTRAREAVKYLRASFSKSESSVCGAAAVRPSSNVVRVAVHCRFGDVNPSRASHIRPVLYQLDRLAGALRANGHDIDVTLHAETKELEPTADGFFAEFGDLVRFVRDGDAKATAFKATVVAANDRSSPKRAGHKGLSGNWTARAFLNEHPLSTLKSETNAEQDSTFTEDPCRAFA